MFDISNLAGIHSNQKCNPVFLSLSEYIDKVFLKV